MLNWFEKKLSFFFPVLCLWQDSRPLWLIGGFFALGLEIFSYLYFQSHLDLWPCAYCVRIRFMMVVIFVSALWAALAPQRLFFKIPGYLLSFAAILEGLRLSWLLEEINVKSLYLLDLNEGCKALVASFPFGLPLARWLPAHFRPIGVCGVDSIWFFLGLSMTQWLIIVYLILLIGLSLMLASFLWQRFSFAAKDG